MPARAWATMAAKDPVGWGEGPGERDAPREDAAARGLPPPPEAATAAAAAALPSFCRFRTARARSRAALALRSSLHRGSTWQQQGTQRVSNNHLSPHGRQPHSLTPHALSMHSKASSGYITVTCARWHVGAARQQPEGAVGSREEGGGGGVCGGAELTPPTATFPPSGTPAWHWVRGAGSHPRQENDVNPHG